MTKALISGITGSGASYLAEYLLSQGVEVHGISRWHSTSSGRNISKIKDKLHLHDCDLTDFSSVLRTLEKVKADYIFHLAAHANVRSCFDNPLAVINNNVNNTINLFEAIRVLKQDPVIQLCGTSECYGLVKPEDTPIKESQPLNPVNIYAVSKLTQEKIALSYFYCYGLKVIVTRMFAYINPRRGDIFSSAFAKQVVDIEKKYTVGGNKIYHGNLDSIRTLIDVRDAMRSYWVASQHCKYGEVYNIGGKDTLSVGQFLDVLIAKSFVPNLKKEVNPNLLRPADVTLQVPDITRFQEATNWQQEYSLEDSIKFLLDYYRNI